MSSSRSKKDKFYTIALATLFLIITWLAFGIRFDGNDDQDLRNLIAGYVSGQPENTVPYMGFIYSGFIALCYGIYDGISWYTVIYMVTVYLASFGILRAVTLAYRTDGKKLDRAGQAAFFACIFVSCILYSAVFMQYSTQSGIMGAAAIASLLSEDKNKRENLHKANLGMGLGLFLLAVNIRVNMGYIVAAVFVATWILQLVRRKIDIRMALQWMAGFLIIMLVSVGLNYTVGNQSSEWEAYNEYNYGRTQFSDFGHPDYETDQEVYQETGWSQTLYYMVGDWFYMDSRVDEEAFNHIYEYRKTNQLDVLGKKAIISMAMPYVIGNDVIKTGFVVAIILIILSVISMRKNLWRGLGAFCYVSGLFAILFYLATDFRMTNWVARGIMVLCIVPAAILLLQSEPQESDNKPILIMLGLGLLVFCLQSLSLFIQKGAGGYGIHTWDLRQTAIEEYAMEHGENIYVNANFSLAANPWEVYDQVDKPVNLIAYGGWNMKSPIYYRQLEANGISEGNFQWLTESNVYLMFNGQVSDLVKIYFKEQYPEKELTKIDQLGGICIYKLR